MSSLIINPFRFASSAVVPVATGSVLFAASASIPEGYLACDGTAVSRTTYSDLYAVVGTSFGVGDGSTTFNLPDFATSTRSVVGAGSGYTIAGTGGVSTVTVTTAQLSSHNHVEADGILSSVTGGSGGGWPYIPSGIISSVSTGSGGSHDNMPPVLGFTFAIKT